MNVFGYGSYYFDSNRVECLVNSIDVLLPSIVKELKDDSCIIPRKDLFSSHNEYCVSTGNSINRDPSSCIGSALDLAETLSKETGVVYVVLVSVIDGYVCINLGQVIAAY